MLQKGVQKACRFYWAPELARVRRSIVYGLVTLAFGILLWRTEHNFEADRQRAEAQTAQGCRDRQVSRRTLRQIAVIATAGATDYEKVPGFAALDPEVQVFLRELRAASQARLSGPGGNSLRDQFMNEAPEILCPGDPGYVPPPTTVRK